MSNPHSPRYRLLMLVVAILLAAIAVLFSGLVELINLRAILKGKP
jgi:ABC-type enterobactin transport system permease subunit